MPINLILLAVTMIANMFRNPVSAATAISGLGAGAVVALDRPPQTTLDWVIVAAGAIGMIANAVQANLIASTKAGQQ